MTWSHSRSQQASETSCTKGSMFHNVSNCSQSPSLVSLGMKCVFAMARFASMAAFWRSCVSWIARVWHYRSI